DKGVDGLRMDAFQFVSKDTSFPVFPPGYEKNIIKYYGAGPHLHDYIQEMNREVLSKYDIMTVAEGAGSSPADAMKFVDPDRHEFSMAYHFEGMDYGHNNPKYDVPGFKALYSRWDSSFAEKGWLSIFLGNHDQPRMVSHWADDTSSYRAAASKMLTTFILTMRGTPYYYYGDELGMTNIKFDRIEDYRDIETRNKYQHLKQVKGDLAAFMDFEKRAARDNGRTPFQWDSSRNAGFTSGTPWIKVNPNYTTINEVSEEQDPNSVLNYFRQAIKLRKDNLALVYGRYTLLDKDNPDIYSYTRELNGEKFLVLLNFKNGAASAHTGMDLSNARVLLGNYATPPKGEQLRPYEAVVYKL
ncbi:MAG: alpha-glucosidase C-terminal domain-containing protein, partial [Bacteroidetes bacterium]|nr:alpha-glucosidase C-terminal domain-containing protein [Bacteroidota bacterium]